MKQRTRGTYVVYTPITLNAIQHASLIERIKNLPPGVSLAALLRDMLINGFRSTSEPNKEPEIDLSGLGEEL